MKSKLVRALAGAALSVIGIQAASAADLPVKAAPMVVAVSNWTGFYVGANIGYGWGTADTATASPTLPFSAPPAAAAYSVIASPQLKPKGVLGGVQVGYNWQINNIVWGVESDLDFMHLRNSAITAGAPPGNVLLTSSTEVKANWLFTLRPRAGLLVTPNSLIYVTGGLALTQLKYAQTDVYTGLAPPEVANISKMKAGWTIGGGWEQKLTDRWTVKAEYLYVDFGSISTTQVNPMSVTTTFSHATDLTAHIARLGVNYKVSP